MRSIQLPEPPINVFGGHVTQTMIDVGPLEASTEGHIQIVITDPGFGQSNGFIVSILPEPATETQTEPATQA